MNVIPKQNSGWFARGGAVSKHSNTNMKQVEPLEEKINVDVSKTYKINEEMCMNTLWNP